MQFTNAVIVFVLAASASATCTKNFVKDHNCCWGGKSGSDACSRQLGTGACVNGIETSNFCVNMGITREQCDADCCDITTGWGIGCPKPPPKE